MINTVLIAKQGYEPADKCGKENGLSIFLSIFISTNPVKNYRLICGKMGFGAAKVANVFK